MFIVSVNPLFCSAHLWDVMFVDRLLDKQSQSQSGELNYGKLGNNFQFIETRKTVHPESGPEQSWAPLRQPRG